MSDEREKIITSVPGPRTAELSPSLRTFESRNVTYLSDEFPIFWESAEGATVTDVDGNRYLDLTAAFGVASAGHCNPNVASTIAEQASRLMHAMGDVHPTQIRTHLLERLARILPPGLTKTFLASTGSEAVEAALKTAALVTGKRRVISFRGAYHGLSLGALSVCGIERFRAPFAAFLGPSNATLGYPRDGEVTAEVALAQTRAVLDDCSDLAAVIIEPIQGRAGCIVPPFGYLTGLRTLCDERKILLIFDEIYTGFGRTGDWFACHHEGVVPDVICLGKALGNGFPIAAAVGSAEVMDAWPLSQGEALHTSTYLGNPMGCAAALATIHEHERLQLPARARRLGARLEPRLHAWRSHPRVTDVRGRGLMWAVQFSDTATAGAVVTSALKRGVIALQCGAAGDAVSIAPPLVISERQLDRAIDLLEAAVLHVE